MMLSDTNLLRRPRSAQADARGRNRNACKRVQPHATACNPVQPHNAIWQNEPTAARDGAFRHICAVRPPRAVDTGLPQLTPVDARLPRHAIWAKRTHRWHIPAHSRAPTLARS